MWAKSGTMSGAFGGAAQVADTGGQAAQPDRERVGDFEIELRAPRAAGDILADFRSLETRSLERNLFAGVDFLAAAATHLADRRDLKIVLVWREGALIGAIPVLVPSAAFSAREIVSPQIVADAKGGPLLDAQNGAAILSAVCAWFARRHAAIVFEGIDENGPFARLLRDFARRLNRQLRLTGASARVPAAPEAGGRDASLAPAPVTLSRAMEPAGLRPAIEEYLILEAQAARAAGREALIQLPGHANFLRTVTRQLGRRRQCQVFGLEIDNALAATAIVLLDGTRAHVWRMASDPEMPAREALEDMLRQRIARAFARRNASDDKSGEAMPERLVRFRLGLAPRGTPLGIARRLREGFRRSAGEIATAAHRRIRTLG